GRARGARPDADLSRPHRGRLALEMGQSRRRQTDIEGPPKMSRHQARDARPRPFVRRGVQVVPQTREGWVITARVVGLLILAQALLLGLAFALPRWSVPAGIAFAVVTVGVSAVFYSWS